VSYMESPYIDLCLSALAVKSHELANTSSRAIITMTCSELSSALHMIWRMRRGITTQRPY